MNALNDLLEKFRSEVKERIDLIGDFSDFKVLRHESSSQWIAILRECNDNQKWRIQRFDENGFVGHEVYQTQGIAVETAARECFCIGDDGALDRLEKTTAFRLGNAISCERDALNLSKITFNEFLVRVSELEQNCSLT